MFQFIKGVVLPILFYFGHNKSFWLAHHQKKKKLWNLPWIKVSIGGWSASPLAHLYRWERGELWAKHMRQQCGAIGNILGNALRTQITPWKLDGKKKRVLPPPPKEKMGPPLPILRLSHLLHAILISKTICHYLSLGLMERWGIWMCIS
jgi:hypothetical protein